MVSALDWGGTALEAKLWKDPRTGTFCYGDTPTPAELCLIPQVFNAQRFEIDLQPYSTIRRIYDVASQLDAFAKATLGQQPDAKKIVVEVGDSGYRRAAI